ncbi:MAG: sigma-54 dependent transcriptional regulator [Candidatus Omnitrophota bacterium]
MNKHRVLLLNNSKLSRKSLYELLSRNGYKVDSADSLKQSIVHLEETAYQLILADIDGASGIELLKTIKERLYPADVIVMASRGNIDKAVDSLKLGAHDYLVKPIEDENILAAVEKVLANKPCNEAKLMSSKRASREEDTFYGLVGRSTAITEIYSIIERISSAKATILLRGESGTGKRMIAKAIHKADKFRRDKPFIEISCGALPREIIESELFGHTKGSFTGAIIDRKGRFELAHGGTVLLDDIDSFSLDLQVKLLRVLQQKELERVGDHKTIKVDIRIIASTNQDLEKAIADGKFREDLYYRLNVISIRIPPLRERKEDLSLLINYFLKHYSMENHKSIKHMTDEARDILTSYNWPGNIRELENIIERAVILDTNNIIGIEDLPAIIINKTTIVKNVSAVSKDTNGSSLKDALKEPEKVYILKILQEVGWNKKKAALKLGVNRTTLYNKLHEHNLLSSFDGKAS